MTKITDKPIYLMSEESIACLLLPVWVFTCNCYVEGLETDSIRGDLLTDESMLSLESEQDIMKDRGTSSCVTNQLRHGRVVATKSGIPIKVLLKTSLSCGSFCSQIPGKQTFTTRSTNHHKEIVPEYSLCRIRCSQERYRLRFTSVWDWA